MLVFFIKENEKSNFLKFMTNHIDIDDDIIYINHNISKIKTKQKIKVVKKIVNIISNTGSDILVLSENLKQDKEFVNLLYSNNIKIVEGKKLYKIILDKIIKNICEKYNIKKEESTISIMTNDIDEWIQKWILKYAREFKNINIVTNHIEYFKLIEAELYNNYGIIVKVNNNRRKSLIKTNLIVNFDFPNELINKYYINDDAIIISIDEKIKIERKRFKGKVIKDYKVKLVEGSNIYNTITKQRYNDFNVKDISECYISNYLDEVDDIIIY